MDQKTRIALAVAAGLLLVAIASMAGRCAVSHLAGEGPAAAPQEQGEGAATSPGGGDGAEGPGFAIAGLADGYLELAGVGEGAIREAVASYCRENVPSATAASFDGEVYWDARSGRVSATFHLDDGDASMVTVTCSDGAVSVAG